jgi:uncharacterized protein with beta-barrel porin domain
MGACVGSGNRLNRRCVGMTSATPAASVLGRVRTRLLGGVSGLALPIASAVLVLGVALSSEADAQAIVNPNQTTTYNLTPASNPIIFGPTTQINATAGDAVYGNAATPWNVTVQKGGTLAGNGIGYGIRLQSQSTLNNAGIITGPSTYGAFLLQGGSVTNQNGGTIQGGITGVAFGAAGTVTNGGTISGGSLGVFVAGGTGMVTNVGAIVGTNLSGVSLYGGGSVTNRSGGAISGGLAGVAVAGGAGTVTNSATISSQYIGVILQSGGGVTNQAGGAISGGYVGVFLANAAGAVTNAGTVTGSIISGVYLRDGGSVINQSAGAISGGPVGVLIGATGAVTNSGTISGRYVGVDLFRGSVTNQAGGTIGGQRYGVIISYGAATVTNAGTITGTNRAGVYLQSGGSVTNQSGGTISSQRYGVIISYSTGTVTNAGTITGTNRVGLYLQSGGSVTNQSGGTISGRRHGVIISGGAGSVTNSGTITGGVYHGVALFGGGSVTNQSGGSISGGRYGAVYIRGPGSNTVTNAGTIAGTAGASVQFAGTGSNTLILQTGSVLNGDAVGSTGVGATNALILQGAGSANNNFLNFNTLDMQASGLWALNGVSAIGTTTIRSGTLVIGDAAHPGAALTSPVTVAAGGTLAGQGSVIGDVTVLGGGAVAPGAASPFSTLNVTGNTTFALGSFYQVNVNGAGQTDKLAISGTANLTGGNVQASLAPGSFPIRSYDILHAAGGLGGTTFSGVSSNLPGFIESLNYTQTDVLLNLTAALGAGSGLGRNQQNVAGALNNFFNNGGTLPPGFLPLFGLSGANLGNALSQISGEASTGAQQGAFQLMTSFLDVMMDSSVEGRGGTGAGGTATPFAPERAEMPQDIALAYAKAMKAPPNLAPNFEQRWNVWGSAFGGGNRTSGDPAVAGSHDLSATAAGVAAGADYHLTPGALIGFALAGGGTSWNLAQNLGGGRSDVFQAGLYGKITNGPAYLAASLAAAEHWISTDRFAFAMDHLTASFNGQSFGGRIEGGYRFAMPLAGITPYAAVQAQSFHTPGYSETDQLSGGFGLAYAARTATDTRSELGSRFDKEMVVSPDAVLRLRGRAAWAHDWVSDPTLAASFQALPGASFIVNGAAPAKDSALTSAGAELRYRSGWSLAAKFDGEFAGHSQTYAGTGTVRYSW